MVGGRGVLNEGAFFYSFFVTLISKHSHVSVTPVLCDTSNSPVVTSRDVTLRRAVRRARATVGYRLQALARR